MILNGALVLRGTLTGECHAQTGSVRAGSSGFDHRQTSLSVPPIQKTSLSWSPIHYLTCQGTLAACWGLGAQAGCRRRRFVRNLGLRDVDIGVGVAGDRRGRRSEAFSIGEVEHSPAARSGVGTERSCCGSGQIRVRTR